MALRKTINQSGDAKLDIDGIKATVTASVNETFYCKVENLNGSKEEMNFNVSFTGESTGASGSKNYGFVPDLSGDNFIAQAYNYLKTLDEFSGATDC